MPLKSCDASKLVINEYMYGMCLVMEHLIDSEGDWKSYFQHNKRMAKFLVGKKYTNSAYKAYDKEVVDSYLKNPAGGFNSSDSLAIPTHKNKNQSAVSSQPEDWPEEACYIYNTSFCNGTCGRQHVCGKCLIRGHKIGSCRVKQEKN